jgi:hypothetical protein
MVRQAHRERDDDDVKWCIAVLSIGDCKAFGANDNLQLGYTRSYRLKIILMSWRTGENNGALPPR